jgi:alkylglycerol monooxygenase
VLTLITATIIVFGVAAELLLSKRLAKDLYSRSDTFVNLSALAFERIAMVLMAVPAYSLYAWAFRHRPFGVSEPLPDGLAFVVAMLGVDLGFYFWHRLSHRVAFLWWGHSIHHSSEEFNVSVAVRSSGWALLTQRFFYLPLAFVGVPVHLMVLTDGISTIYTLFVHNRVVGKLGWIEKVFVTPSSHRVHHGRNPEYIDTNFGATFILWDRLFGTYVPETVPVVFGLVHPLNTHNVGWARFHVLWEILGQVRQAPGFSRKLRVPFLPPGASAFGVPSAVPAALPTSRPKPAVTGRALAYAYAQHVMVFLLVAVFIAESETLSLLLRFAAALWLGISLATVGALLDARPWAKTVEVARWAILFLAVGLLATTRPAGATAEDPCREFVRFATSPRYSKTDGIVVVRDGQIKYEFYDGNYGPDRAHPLWSTTKTITGALLGIAVAEGRVSLQQRLAEFYPRLPRDPAYERIRVEDLFYMDTGFEWDELAASGLTSNPVLRMLFGDGRFDMPGFAAGFPVSPKGPASEWRYSTGTTTLLAGVLRKVYGTEYDRAPWTRLFGPLGMKSAVVERDNSGNFVGGAYGFATPRDMARLGQLYLNRGRWNGRTVLTEDWIKRTLTPSPGYLANDPETNAKTDAVYGGSIWLNRPVSSRPSRPFPHAPEDMYLTIGSRGQLVIVLPSQKMVIARTGFDFEYASKIDAFVSRALACFDEPLTPLAEVPGTRVTSTSGWIDDLLELNSPTSGGIYLNSVAKWVCSCVFVSSIKDVPVCLEKSNIPLASRLIEVTVDDSPGSRRVTTTLTWLGRRLFADHAAARAQWDERQPQSGCLLLER